jgi:hypothetical protein
LDLPAYKGIHPIFNVDCLKLYKTSMLDGDEESIASIHEELVAKVGT